MKTREEWLNKAAALMAPWFAEEGFPLPPSVLVSFGFCGGKSVGMAIDARNSEDETTPHVFVSPCRKDPIQILSILLHELIHCAVGHQHRHGGEFKRLARKFGLAGKLTATHVEEGSALYDRLLVLSSQLGQLPHVPLTNRQKAEGKSGGGWIKLRSENEPSYILRISAKAFREYGAPTDPFGSVMVAEDE